jgi:CelD/BcsL family acetyltransferase involved in cellulose biosynthesis
MHVVELHDWNERPGLMADWERLWSKQSSAPVFVHPTWARTWWRYFGRGRRLRILVVEDAGRIVALAPLFLERPLPVPGRLRIIGAGVTNDFHDWLLPVDPGKRAECLRLLFDHLATRRDWLRLEIQGLRSDSIMLPLVDLARDRHLLIRTRPGPLNLVVPTRGTWACYLGTRGGNVRRNLGKKQRRLARLGDVAYVHADGGTAAAAVEETIQLHGLRWAGRDDSTLVSRSARGRAFYRAVLPPLVEAGIADLVSLRLDGRAIATQVGFQIGDTYFNYQAAFDPGLARYSPSTLLLAYLLERARENDLKMFDFMTGDEPYKHEWAAECRPVTHMSILPDRLLARALNRLIEIGLRLRALGREASRRRRTA